MYIIADIILYQIWLVTLYRTTKFKACADDNINLTQKSEFVLERIENILGKGENAGYQLFFLKGRYKLGLCDKKLYKL